jgi:hypothetical protein
VRYEMVHVYVATALAGHTIGLRREGRTVAVWFYELRLGSFVYGFDKSVSRPDRACRGAGSPHRSPRPGRSPRADPSSSSPAPASGWVVRDREKVTASRDSLPQTHRVKSSRASHIPRLLHVLHRSRALFFLLSPLLLSNSRGIVARGSRRCGRALLGERDGARFDRGGDGRRGSTLCPLAHDALAMAVRLRHAKHRVRAREEPARTPWLLVFNFAVRAGWCFRAIPGHSPRSWRCARISSQLCRR